MTIGSGIYKLLIGPLELFFEVVFALANRVVHHPGLAIVALSLSMNFLVLPLYRRADAMQAEERDQANKMKPWVDHIRKTFKGDERFMMLQTYYRQNGYKQTDALKGSVSLLLEIPFFIAAYRFLSGLQLLQGVSFGPIRDLGAPDALIVLGGLTVNLLPILMTAINVISAAIYMKGFPLKSKIQMYGMALIFLIFLYSSPSGLVFYWTLNNVFSLLKNIFYKMKHPRVVLSICASAAGLLLLAVLVIHPIASRRKLLFVVFAALLLQLPLVLGWLKGKGRLPAVPAAGKTDDRIFNICCVFLALLTGVLIPSAVIKASPSEFVNIMHYKSPLWYVLSAALLAAGTFIIWCGIFYRLSGPQGRKLFGLGAWVLAGAAVTDYMFFGTHYGDISPMLVYNIFPKVSTKDYFINLLVLGVLFVVFMLVWRKKIAFVRVAALTLCLATIGMSGMNITSIQRKLNDIKSDIEVANKDMPVIPLSKEGKNVIIVMLDRACGYFVPYIMGEYPQLKEQFAGFTFYPNAISYGTNTNIGTPALFGGYEYLPTEINKRTDKPLVQEQNEALRLMPVLFDEAGYDVTVCDPTYAGYKWIPDLSIYKDHPDIHAYITRGKFEVEIDLDRAAEKSLNRNFFCFSIYKIAPLICQPTLYTRGLYNEADVLAGVHETDAAAVQTMDGLSKASGISSKVLNDFAVLNNLPSITEIRDDSDGTFMMMCNELPHEPALLQLPDYTPAARVDNTKYDSTPITRRSEDGREIILETETQITHYHVNTSALFQLGKWFDYLRANNVYDNTRIILVADHGIVGLYYPEMQYGSAWWEDLAAFNPILMVKDFGGQEYSVDDQFMTHADVPLLAFDGIIEDPVNPATGMPVTDETKQEPEQQVQYVVTWDIEENHGTTFMPGHWFSVHDNIYDLNNWRYLGDY